MIGYKNVSSETVNDGLAYTNVNDVKNIRMKLKKLYSKKWKEVHNFISR